MILTGAIADYENITYLAIVNLINGSLVKTKDSTINPSALIILNNGYLVGGGEFGYILIYNLSEEKKIRKIQSSHRLVRDIIRIASIRIFGECF